MPPLENACIPQDMSVPANIILQGSRSVLIRQLLQDTQDPNPLIRALAVRTMGCIRVDKITEYLCDPLQRCLKVRWSYDSHYTDIRLGLNAF